VVFGVNESIYFYDTQVDVRYIRASKPQKCWAHTAIITGLDGIENLIGSMFPFTKFVWWTMKTGRPEHYADMPYKSRGQLPPPPPRLDAKYMMDNFDVSIEDIRQLCIDKDPYSLVIGSDKEAGLALRESLQNELDTMKPLEQTANFMQFTEKVHFSYLFAADEQTWLSVGSVSIPKRKRTELPDVAEESEDSEDDLDDLTGPQVEQTKRMIGPILEEIDRSIWFR